MTPAQIKDKLYHLKRIIKYAQDKGHYNLIVDVEILNILLSAADVCDHGVMGSSNCEDCKQEKNT